ncbi:MAG: hypothetical protein ACJAVO_000579 [Parvibaculaceae bacterium]
MAFFFAGAFFAVAFLATVFFFVGVLAIAVILKLLNGGLYLIDKAVLI